MDEKVFEHYCNSPVLAFYKRTLDEIGKERKHTLSARGGTYSQYEC